ncbi:acetyl-CoA carboxylase carboxyltransferase subunit alpha [Oceanibaculum nanhaiense]|jgi:acetyl-CoA carboxylase carboxyl transferase subunit alpha|uniref:acetyl-CoA carboxylase carboxyltransferase subunit alpha n=1 Tax=Oceanibaculum nanhaiense TaxID=1909734 RepID=UPI0019A4597F|nr:acetyl-CoA carboxylase carboxyltransferase subunit alpha [Oceanibaculum nanhaiense]MBC7134101.1 acetyl-CoA carboxylase carboxyltransferase subunit alpha [Oceanibaculum nanhaiense]MDM7945545.1 acetyl-CoA carboxylase carboxyltransferase subunit alpha [Oceanibaculum nanhaiense]
MRSFLDFEKPIAEVEGKIEELRHLSGGSEINIAEEVARLEGKVERLLLTTYQKLTPWQKVQVARHQDRPRFRNIISHLIEEFTPLAGDRNFGEDSALPGGLGRFRGHSVVVMGMEKGSTTEERVRYNFGMAKPEGYRKARRLIELADRFGLPIVTFIDTAGAYPGVGAEERGQAEAIARSIEACLAVKVPVIACIVGEGGSGGAIALAAADHIIMFEHSVYSVISPEGCASILWRSADQSQVAAEALRLTAQDLHKLDVIDEIVQEPVGGAHRRPDEALTALGDSIEKALKILLPQNGKDLKAKRREKFLAMGKIGLS